jgi:hypothetical protein
MVARWICLVTGTHRWTTHETDEGEVYERCLRCRKLLWDRGDQSRITTVHP